MEILSISTPEKLIKELTEQAKLAGIESRSNFIRLLLIAGIHQVKKDGFHSFVGQSAEKAKLG